MARLRHYPRRLARLTPEFVRTGYRSILDGLPAADAAGDAAPWLAAIDGWSALRSRVESKRSRSHYTCSKNCLDYPIAETGRAADLRSPFDAGVMAGLAAPASRECALS